jgi:hypothetical protein
MAGNDGTDASSMRRAFALGLRGGLAAVLLFATVFLNIITPELQTGT